MRGAEFYGQADKSKTVKKVVVLGQEVSEDLLKKMSFAEARSFCLSTENDFKKLVSTPSMYSALTLGSSTKPLPSTPKNDFSSTISRAYSISIIRYCPVTRRNQSLTRKD